MRPASSCPELGASARGITGFHDAKRKPAIQARVSRRCRLPSTARSSYRARAQEPSSTEAFRLSRRYRRLRRDIFQPPGRHRVADRKARVPCPAYSPTSFRGIAYTERTKHAACNRCGRRPRGNGQLSLFAKRKRRRRTDRLTVTLQVKRLPEV